MKTRIPAFGPILIAAAFAPLSLHGQSADSLARDHPVPDCAARESGNARPFDKSRPEVLVGPYELTMVSAWEEAAGRWSWGKLEIWRTPGGKVQGASDIDLDSLRVPGSPPDDPSSDYLGSGDLASRDTLRPGLAYVSFAFLDADFQLAPVVQIDGSMSWLEVDSLSNGGFWGRWDSDLGNISLVKEGRILSNPHGTFCAVSVRESDGAGADQGRRAVVAEATLFAADDAPNVQCDSSYVGVCIPPPPPDLDCGNVPHRGFRIVGADPHRFDRDNDGIGCEGS